MSRRLPWLIVALVVLACPPPSVWAAGKSKPAAKSAKKAAATPEEIQKKFEVFVVGWMDKLRERQRFNVEKLEWHPSPEGVEGVFVGYDTTNYQILPLVNVETAPIGKIVYMELKLRVAGPSKSEALANSPQVIERVEVTELFRFTSGEWVY